MSRVRRQRKAKGYPSLTIRDRVIIVTLLVVGLALAGLLGSGGVGQIVFSIVLIGTIIGVGFKYRRKAGTPPDVGQESDGRSG